MKQPIPKPSRPLLNRVLCNHVGQEIPPLDVPMPLAIVRPRGPDLRELFRNLPPRPVATANREGGAA